MYQEADVVKVDDPVHHVPQEVPIHTSINFRRVTAFTTHAPARDRDGRANPIVPAERLVLA